LFKLSFFATSCQNPPTGNHQFIDKKTSLATYWRSVILLGRNTASYKFALSKTSLELQKKSNFIDIDDLALPFAKYVSEYIKENDRQATEVNDRYS
jgi:hypothetical protein